jgi:hypothetical protein
MNIKYFLILIVLVVFSCKKDDITITKEITLLPFKDISIENAFDIELVEGAEYKIVISGKKEKYIDEISYVIENEKLILKDNKKFKFLNPGNVLKITIHSPKFYALELYGGVDLTCRDYLTSNSIGVVFKKHGNYCDIKLNNQLFYFWDDNLAGGDLILSGSTKNVNLWFSNLVNVNAYNLSAEYVLISANTENDTKINVTNKLEYEILGDGNIIAYGNPNEIVKTVGRVPLGGGQLILK